MELVIRMKFNCVKYLPWSQKILTEPALVKLIMDQLSRVRTNKLATIMTITMNIAREFQNHKVNPNFPPENSSRHDFLSTSQVSVPNDSMIKCRRADRTGQDRPQS